MPNYQAAVLSTPAPASAAPYATFHTGASNQARIYKMIMTNTQTVFSQVAIYNASSNSPVATTSSLGKANILADHASTCNLDTAWSTAPTVAAPYWEAFSLGPSQGSGLQDVWQSDKEMTVAVSTFVVFWNQGAGAGGICSLTIAFDE